MTLFAIFGLAVALAMDAFAVAITSGIQLRCVSAAQILRMASVFGGLQFLMPVIGWLLGIRAHQYIAAYDHWLAFGLLVFVGARMVKDGWTSSEGEKIDACATCPDPTRGTALWLLGIATSLDALAVGLSLAVLDTDVWFPAVIIGIVCFVMTAFGIHLGRLVCSIPWVEKIGTKANALGGLVLIFIGFGILREHGAF